MVKVDPTAGTTADARAVAQNVAEAPAAARLFRVTRITASRLESWAPLIGVLVALSTALVIVRGIVFVPGWVEYSADFSTNMSRGMELLSWSSAWNGFTGDDSSATLSLAPLFALPLTLFDTATGQKLALLSVYLVMGLTAFFALLSWLRDSGSKGAALPLSCVGAFIYVVNPWVAAESVHLLYLWLYALIPVTFHLIRKCVSAESHASAARLAALAGLTCAGTLTAYGIAFHSILAGVLLIAHFRHIGLKRILAVLAGFGSLLTLASAYWLLPIALSFRQNFQNGTSWALFTTKDIYFLSPVSAFPYSLRGTYSDVTQALAGPLIGGNAVAIAMLLGCALPLAAAGSLIVLRQRFTRIEGGLLAAGSLFLLLANGTSPPIGDAYARLASAPVFNQFAFVLFKGPYKFVPMALFTMVFLALATISALLTTGTRGKLGALAILVALGAWSVGLGSPLLTGDLAGYMRPVDPPEAFKASLRAVASITGDQIGARAIWLPFSTSGDPENPAWVPQRTPLPLIDGQVPPVASWAAPTPISSRGVSWLAPAAGRIRDQFVMHVIRDDLNANLGSLLRALGCGFIVLRLDTAESASILTSLDHRSGVVRAYSDANIVVFKATEPPPDKVAFSSPSILVGDLDGLSSASSRAGSAPNRVPYLLATDLPNNAGILAQLLGATTEVDFGPAKGWSDLVLDSWSGPGSIVNAADLVRETVPLSAWDKDSFDSHVWIPYRLGGLSGALYDASRASTFVLANGKASLTVKLPAQTVGRELWVRVLSSPLSYSVSASGDAVQTGSVSTFADTSLGWLWVKVTELPPNTTQVRISVDGALSAIDQIAAVPDGAVETEIARIKSITSSADLAIGGPWQNLEAPLMRINGLPNQAFQITAVSGQLTSSPTATALPLTLTGNSHPLSSFWSFVVKFAPQDWSKAELLNLDLSIPAGLQNNPLNVRLYDDAGAALLLRSSTEAPGERVFALKANRLIALQADGLATFNLDRVSGIGFSFANRVDPSLPASVDFRGIGLSIAATSSRRISVPEPGAYMLLVQAAKANATSRLRIDGKTYPLRVQDPTWLATPPFQITGDEVTIEGESLGTAILWHSPTNRAWAPEHPISNSSRTATLNFPETYNVGWVASGGQILAHYKLNGFLNGYVVMNEPGTRVVVRFEPELLLVIGRLISIIFVIVFLVLVAMAVLRRARRRSPPSTGSGEPYQ